ncbi:MAG: ester cyclase [Bacteroidia bacterium]|nr:ester cyclase [Bacteroidia bacterium]
MKQEEVVNQLANAIESKNWNKAEAQLTEDFQFSGAVPTPINKKEWLNVQRAIQTGIPDLKLNIRVTEAKGDKVYAKASLAGTHTADMPVTIPGSHPATKTGKKIKMPEETLEFTIRGEKIAKIHVTPVANGGVPGLLEQVGALQHA